MAQTSSNLFKVIVQSPRPSGETPAWVPPVGYFADVPMLNNPQDVLPSIYAGDSMGMSSPFINWGGSAILRDFSPLGAQVYYSGGHESSTAQANLQMSLICDFSTLQWSTANVPVAANRNDVFMANGMAPDGTPYTPHTYLGLQELPAAWGGGNRGSLVSFFWAGSNYSNRINLLDVSKATHGYSQMKTNQAQNIDPSKIRFSPTSADSGSYPITVMDNDRQGWWAAPSGSAAYTLFISKTGQITQYPAVGGNLANGALVLCPSLNLLIAIDGGYSAGQYAGTGHRTIHIRNLATGAVTRSTTLGKVPSLSPGYDGTPDIFNRPDVMGLQWVEELNCVVGLDQSVSPPAVVKLSPPANNPATDAWTWSTITTLQHWAQDAGGQTKLQAAQNNIWSKFRWVPLLKGFVYATAKNRKPQIIRLS
ncbi:MAG: hypothetical protein V4693_11570 [Pseudomonadota bacterium]